jgi:hypothetical protein
VAVHVRLNAEVLQQQLEKARAQVGSAWGHNVEGAGMGTTFAAFGASLGGWGSRDA